MIWLAWRQFRAQAIVASAALVAVAMALLGTGPHLVSLFDSSGLATCQSGCGTDAGNFINQVKGSTTELIFYGGVFLVYAVPALIGLFWGAPLVAREFEAGTFRLAWSQSVTRARWIAVKLGLICLAGMATAGLLSLMTAWWGQPALPGRPEGPAELAQHQPAGTPALRRNWCRADRLCGVRLRPRCHHRCADPPNAAGDGRHARDLRGDPDLLANRRPATPHPPSAIGPGAEHR